MDNNKHIEIEHLMVITDRKKKAEMSALLTEYGAKMIKTIYARGSVKATALKDVFGFLPEENKIILTCLLSSEKAAVLIEILNNKYNFKMPNTGIAFTVPVEGLSF